MSRVLINEQGAYELKALAEKLNKSLTIMKDVQNNLAIRIKTLNDVGLGIDGEEIIRIINEMACMLNQISPDIECLSKKLKQASLQIEQIVNASNKLKTGSNEHSVLENNGLSIMRDRLNSSSSSERYKEIVSKLEKLKVEYNAIKVNSTERTSEEIISELGGGDRTRGSCSSLSFAYIGNRAGYCVLDFRGGESRRYFSNNKSIIKIANLPNVQSQIIYGKDDFVHSFELLNSMEFGKEYYLATGVHATIVRKTYTGFEYLELQSPNKNGWHKLDNDILKLRFGCTKFNVRSYPNILIDVNSLLKNEEFLDILGYINTDEKSEMKGEWGSAK